ncbi:MAG: OmpA family protein, partial [Chitinophagaceae bacterium]
DANTGHGNYAAVTAGSVLFFTSSRADSSVNVKGPKRNHLYRIVGTEAILADPLTGQDVDQGLCTFTPDGRRAFFTVWKSEGGKKSAQIYTATREDGGWTAPEALGAEVNTPGSNAAQPCYVATGGQDGYLYFSSDRAGGAGGYDLYVADIDAAGKAGRVSSLGQTINTAGDEAAPFYHKPTAMLVFASNGRPGMGGFDLYASPATTRGFVVQPVHLGTPINSVKDDSYFYSAAKDSNIFRNAYISSDRASDCCLEIYTVSRQDPPKPEPQPGPVPPRDSVVTPPVVAAWTPPVLLFDFDKAELSVEAKSQLDTVFLQMEQKPSMRLRIGGYTDGKGGEGYNNRLSDRRARAVRDYLAAKGITPGRLWIKGFGECCPVVPETADGRDDAEARRQNRRVELSVEQ